MDSITRYTSWVLTLFLIFRAGYGFYIPLGSPRKYSIGEPLYLKANSLTSISTALPFSYYTFPFCKPPWGVKDFPEDLGQLLMGDRIQNSPYRIKMFTNETQVFLCQSGPLTAEEVSILKKRIDETYQVNLILENLPALWYAASHGGVTKWNGFPVGMRLHNNRYYVFNHLKFKVLVHREAQDGRLNAPIYTAVGFELVPCSYWHDPMAAENLRIYDKFPCQIQCDHRILEKEIKENEPIAFSYEVAFEESNVKWQSRWDAYLPIKEWSWYHWTSIFNSLVMISFLSGGLLTTFRVTLGWGLTVKQYEKFHKEAHSWKLTVGDISCSPACPTLLCAMIGGGVQILGMAVGTILLAALGFVSLISPTSLLTCMIFLFLVLGTAAGYVAVRIWRVIGNKDDKGWVSVSWRVAWFFPAIVLLVLTPMNFLLWSYHSTRRIEFPMFGVLILLWLGICVPLTLIGGYIGQNAPEVTYCFPVKEIRGESPRGKSYLSWFSVLCAGIIPFSTLMGELFWILHSFWMHKFYHSYGFLLIVAILLVVSCMEVSIIMTLSHLSKGHCRWWWKSFFASGSAGMYTFFYFIYFQVHMLRLVNEPASKALYFGYALLVAIAIMLAAGAVGVLSTFWFLHHAPAYVKPELMALPDSKVGSTSKGNAFTTM